MTLSPEQLKKIESRLYKAYDFYYDDTKYEIIDHIALEIESLMPCHSFSTAFDITFEKWHHQLQETEWNGMYIYGSMKIPLLYKKQLQQSFYLDFIYYLAAVLLLPLLLFLLKDQLEIKTINHIAFIYKILLSGSAILSSWYVVNHYKKGNYTTVYGQIAVFNTKKNITPITLLSIIFTAQNQLTYYENMDIWLLSLLFINMFFFLFIIKNANYLRHLQTVKKIKKWTIA